MASFHTTIPDPDDLFKCPYDAVHMIRYKKMPYHLMKCRKNHLNQKMDVCPFNARHAIPAAELRFHMANCPDKHTVERQDTRLMNDPTRISGNTDVPTYYPDVAMPEAEENWDEETVRPRIGVHPRDLAGIGYVKDLTGFKPSQKKAYYANLSRGDTEANVRLVEGISSFSLDNGGVASAAAGDRLERVNRSGESGLAAAVGRPERVSKGAEGSSPMLDPIVSAQPPHKPVTTFAQPTMGRGRGRMAAKSVTPGAAACPDTHSAALPTVNVPKLIRKLKKKIREAEHLVERQANGESLNEEERVKVAMKTTMEYQLGELMAAEYEA